VRCNDMEPTDAEKLKAARFTRSVFASWRLMITFRSFFSLYPARRSSASLQHEQNPPALRSFSCCFGAPPEGSVSVTIWRATKAGGLAVCGGLARSAGRGW